MRWLALLLGSSFAALAALAGCSSFGSAGDGATGTTPDGGSAEGGALDASGPGDPGDADGGTGCSGAHFLCDDFEADDAGWPGSRWDTSTSRTGALDRSTTKAHSPTRSLVLTADANGEASLTKTHIGAFSNLTCSLWLNLETIPSGGGGFLYLESSNGTGQGYYASFGVFEHSFTLDEGSGGSSQFSTGFGNTASGWINVKVGLQPGMGLAWSAASTDGAVAQPIVGSYASRMSVADVTSLKDVSVTVGLIRDGTPSSWQTYVDDVVCDVSP